MKKILLLTMIIAYACSCKNPKADLSGDEKVSVEDFLKVFKDLKLPISISDSSLEHFGDTAVISKAVLEEFISDSALQKLQDKSDNKYTIQPAGRIHEKEKDFLLIKFTSNKKIRLEVFVMDDKHKFLALLPLITNTEKDNYKHSVIITEEPTFIIKKEKTTADNSSQYSRNGFAYSAASNNFAKVLHDSNEDTAHADEVINPIDTFPSTNKFSGDYISNKKNFISIRDGKNAAGYVFFIHFEKNNGECVGELKGNMNLTDEKNAVFNESGDACVIDFKFSANSVTVKEQDNCGNHRGINCPFDFTFKKKNQTKKKAK